MIASDVGQDLAVVEIMTDSFGNGMSTSAAVSVSFQPSDDAALIGWWDASDVTTITETSGLVSSWADKAGGAALASGAPQAPGIGTRSLNGVNVRDLTAAHLADAFRREVRIKLGLKKRQVRCAGQAGHTEHE